MHKLAAASCVTFLNPNAYFAVVGDVRIWDVPYSGSRGYYLFIVSVIYVLKEPPLPHATFMSIAWWGVSDSLKPAFKLVFSLLCLKSRAENTAFFSSTGTGCLCVPGFFLQVPEVQCPDACVNSGQLVCCTPSLPLVQNEISVLV